MQTIKIFFADFWKGFDIHNNFITRTLHDLGFEITIDTSPDFLFYSSSGKDFLKYNNCVKIYFTGENDVPDFNYCDYAISFHHISFGTRHLRYPLYLLYGNSYNQLNQKVFSTELTTRRFCNFVYSNSKLADPFREYFFSELSKYKKVDSGGRLLNNLGAPVKNKLEFIKEYKFTIAFENSSVNGYTTEKIVEPMFVNSVPIYWGNPTVNLDFNEESFVWIKDKRKIKDVIDYIIFLDTNDDAYLKLLSNPWLTDEQLSQDWDRKLSSFLNNICSKSPEEARQVSEYGFSKLYRKKPFFLVNALTDSLIKGFKGR